MITEALTLIFAGLTGGYLAARERHNRKSIKHLTERVQKINGYIEDQERDKKRYDLGTYWWNKNDHWVDQKNNKIPESEQELKNILSDKQYTIYEKYVKRVTDKKEKAQEKEEGGVKVTLSPQAVRSYIQQNKPE